MGNSEQPNLGSQFKISRIQKLIGKRMLDSKRRLPCFYLNVPADLTELNKFRRTKSKELKAKLSTNDFFFAAMSKAIKCYPLMAAQLMDDSLLISEHINVGFAVAAPQGLVVPVIKETESKNIVDISLDTQELTKRAKSAKLTPDQMSGANIILSSLGMFGTHSFIAVLPPGAVSILAIGKLVPKIVYRNGVYEPRKIMALSLAVDHRIVNGVYAAKFLKLIVDLLENPDMLID